MNVKHDRFLDEDSLDELKGSVYRYLEVELSKEKYGGMSLDDIHELTEGIEALFRRVTHE